MPKKEIWVVTIRVNMIRVFSPEIFPVVSGGVSIVEVPPGIIRGDYKHLQIEIERKEGYSKWKDTPI